MPPLVPNQAARQVQALANPANAARALAQQQAGGTSGTIPGTSSDPTQVATTTGVIPLYPPDARSPNGDQVAGVGIQVLNNDGNPVVVMGNLKATIPAIILSGPLRAGATGSFAAGAGEASLRASVADLPSGFEDGGFCFVDADGNLVAGYSQETGLWGFGGDAAGIIAQHEVTGDYTFVNTDVAKVVESLGSSACTWTVPLALSTAIIGGWIEVFQYGTGQVTIAPGSGVTLLSDGARVKTAGQYATIRIRLRDTEVVLSGDLV